MKPSLRRPTNAAAGTRSVVDALKKRNKCAVTSGCVLKFNHRGACQIQGPQQSTESARIGGGESDRHSRRCSDVYRNSKGTPNTEEWPGSAQLSWGADQGAIVAPVSEGKIRQWIPGTSKGGRWKDIYLKVELGGDVLIWNGNSSKGSPKPTHCIKSFTVSADEEDATRLTLNNINAGGDRLEPRMHLKIEHADMRDALSRTSTGHLAASRALYKTTVGRYCLGANLGHGSFAEVVEGIVWESGERIAVKIIRHEIVQESQGLDQIMNEALQLSRLSHRNIIRLRDVIYHEGPSMPTGTILLILELASGGELLSKVVDAGRLSEDRSRFYFRQLLDGVAYCHRKRVCHRDLKLENLVLDSSGLVLKITDFGFAKDLSSDSQAKSVLGTAVYIAPEVLTLSTGQQYNGFKADMWQCGVILYTMAVGQYPFHSSSKSYEIILKGEYKTPGHMSTPLQGLLGHLIQIDVDRRIDAERAMTDPWVLSNDHNSTDVEQRHDQLTDPEFSETVWNQKIEEIRKRAAVDAGEELQLSERALTLVEYFDDASDEFMLDTFPDSSPGDPRRHTDPAMTVSPPPMSPQPRATKSEILRSVSEAVPGYEKQLHREMSMTAERHKKTLQAISAVRDSQEDRVRTWLREDGDVNSPVFGCGHTAFTLACEEGHLEIVQLLLRRNCNTAVKTHNGLTGWQCARRGGHGDVVEMLHALATADPCLHPELQSEMTRQQADEDANFAGPYKAVSEQVIEFERLQEKQQAELQNKLRTKSTPSGRIKRAHQAQRCRSYPKGPTARFGG
eukprot:COSAG05_NODE_445_length_9773_cov_4.588071_10_plen_790_part_00